MLTVSKIRITSDNATGLAPAQFQPGRQSGRGSLIQRRCREERSGGAGDVFGIPLLHLAQDAIPKVFRRVAASARGRRGGCPPPSIAMHRTRLAREHVGRRNLSSSLEARAVAPRAVCGSALRMPTR